MTILQNFYITCQFKCFSIALFIIFRNKLKSMSRYLFFLMVLFFISCKDNQVSPEVEQWKSQAENVEIIRDDFGVPHIYGKTDADAVFGLLYAQCEDDFNRVEQNYIWATGRLAEVEGEEAIYSDLRARLFMTEEEAKANYEKSPDWLKKLCDMHTLID